MSRSPGTAAASRSSRTVSVAGALDCSVAVSPGSPRTLSTPPSRALPLMVATTLVPAMPEAGKMPLAAGAHTAPARAGTTSHAAASAAARDARRVTGRTKP